MSLREDVKNFVDSIAAATSNAPDEYSEWSSWTYETHMADLKDLWAKIRPRIKRDLELAEFVDTKLQEMFVAFDGREKDKGRQAALAIYNSDVGKLR